MVFSRLECQLIVLMTALAAAACERPAASAVPAPPRGDFRVLLPARPRSLNPHVELDEPALVVSRSIYNQLLTINETGRLLPELASTWTTSGDGLAYTFLLRSGIRWHDGAPFTADDVKWTLETVAREGWARDVMTAVASVDAPDPQTVVVRLRHAWAPFATDLAGLGLAILPRHVYRGSDWRTHAANGRPIGTGPFRFSEWRGDGVIVLEANRDYFRPGPHVERLIFQPAPPEEVLRRLESGDADYSVSRIRPEDIRAAGDGGPVAVRTLPTSARYYLTFNLRRPPFDDVRVRRAIASAIDRMALLRTALAGRGSPAVGWYTPDVEWAYNAAARVPDHDLQTAKRLLNEADLRPRGVASRLRARLVVADSPPLTTLAEALREQLAEIGITLEVDAMPTSEWPRRVMVARDFDVSIFTGTQGPDPDALRRRFAAKGPGEFIGYESAAFVEAVERGARTMDLAQRAEAYHAAQDILAADVPFVPLLETVKVVAFNRRVAGLPQLEARGLVGTFDFSLVRLQPQAGGALR